MVDLVVEREEIDRAHVQSSHIVNDDSASQAMIFRLEDVGK